MLFLGQWQKPLRVTESSGASPSWGSDCIVSAHVPLKPSHVATSHINGGGAGRTCGDGTACEKTGGPAPLLISASVIIEGGALVTFVAANSPPPGRWTSSRKPGLSKGSMTSTNSITYREGPSVQIAEPTEDVPTQTVAPAQTATLVCNYELNQKKVVFCHWRESRNMNCLDVARPGGQSTMQGSLVHTVPEGRITQDL